MAAGWAGFRNRSSPSGTASSPNISMRVAQDTDTMRRLNAEVERDRQEPADVAKAFLKAKGLLR